MNPYVSALLEHVVPVLFTILSPVILLLAHKAVLAFEKKTGIELSAEHEIKLNDMLVKSLARAEEWSNRKVKLGEDAPTGAQKLDMALDFAMAEAQRLKLDVKARDYLAAHLEAKLGLTR